VLRVHADVSQSFQIFRILSPNTNTNHNHNPRYLTLIFLRNVRCETPGYEKVRVRNIWRPFRDGSFMDIRPRDSVETDVL